MQTAIPPLKTPAAITAVTAMPGVDVHSWQVHGLHGAATDWAEKNCYADVWIEILHALRLEPLAMLGFSIAVDFEGDQWTFFKPPHAALRSLYGIDVQELTVWRPLLDHVQEHLAAGKLICTEADAFWLPDTAGTDYRSKHTKTTIVAVEVDEAARRLVYFHNAGLFELSGEDFERTFRIGEPPDPAFMPLFAELVRIDRVRALPEGELARRAAALLRDHFEWRPANNPFIRFGERVQADMDRLLASGIDHYHAWAFAAIRQAGGAFELAAAHLRWLESVGMGSFEPAARHFQAISSANKALILKGARAAHTGRPFDAIAAAEPMARAWDEGMSELGRALQ